MLSNLYFLEFLPPSYFDFLAFIDLLENDFNSSSSEMVLKCDLHEALIDPLTLLNGEYFVSITYRIMQTNHTTPNHATPYHTTPHYATPNHTTPHYTTPKHTILNHTTPCHNTLHCPKHNIQHHITLHQITPHHTMQSIPHHAY